MQRADRHGQLLGQRTRTAAADPDLLPVLADVLVTPPAPAAHAVAEHGVAHHPAADPRRVDAVADAGDRARPLVPEAHRVGRVPLVQVGHLAGEELHVGAADADPLDVDDDLAGLAAGAGTSCTALPGPVRTNARIVRAHRGADHVLPLRPQTLDAELHHVARLQPHRRAEAHAHPRRRTGVDQVARLQDQELAQVVHEEVRVEDHRRGVAGLPADAVDVQPHVQREDVVDLVRGDQPRPGRVEGLGRLALDPLAAALDLERPLADVVDDQVAGDRVAASSTESR